MALPQSPDKDIEQLRSVAGRIATLIQNGDNKGAALSRFTEALTRDGQLADLLIEYSSRWFQDTNGKSILVGPELFWLLTAAESRGATDQSAPKPAEEYTEIRRSRHILLLCVMENLAGAESRPEPTTGPEPKAKPETAPRFPNGAPPVLNSRVTTPSK